MTTQSVKLSQPFRDSAPCCSKSQSSSYCSNPASIKMFDTAEIAKIKRIVHFLCKLKFLPFQYNTRLETFQAHKSHFYSWLSYFAFAVFLAQTTFVALRLIQYSLMYLGGAGNEARADDFYLILWHINVAASSTVICIWYLQAFVGERCAVCQILNFLYSSQRSAQAAYIGGTDTLTLLYIRIQRCINFSFGL